MHTSARARNRGIGALVAFTILAITASYVFANELSSSGFRFNDSGFTQLGGFSSTTNFQQFGTLQPVADGESSSASFQVASGYLYPADVSPFASQNWRWYDDAAANTPTVPYAGENVAPSAIPYNDPFKLRIVVNNLGADYANIKFRLEYSTSSSFSTVTTFVGENGECSTSIIWCYAPGAGIDNTVIAQATLSDAQSCSGGVGNGCGSYNKSGTTTSPFYFFGSTRKEFDFTIKQTEAQESIVYYFRLVDKVTNIPVPLNSGETYPSLMVDGGTLSFAIDGISSGQSTEGVTTDITTLPTSVVFGSLGLGTARVAAHRLTVSTNAGHGYKIYTYQRQGLLSPSAREIPPVLSTNDAPAGWSSACSATSTGCYGYHTGEDVLEGGSIRFAADDSFARFTSSPTEVAYASGPTSASSTDIIYKVEVRDSQDAGAYQGAIVYIVTPVF
ncbi:MAG: hypothetical protein KBD06_02460 [Candidatus Pacebacteria bacterium]|nr:hypothetical protein [Candidatus Paceibacterota bacterium]